MLYKVEFEDESCELIVTNSDEEADDMAMNMQEEYGKTVFNVWLLDYDDNIVYSIF